MHHQPFFSDSHWSTGVEPIKASYNLEHLWGLSWQRERKEVEAVKGQVLMEVHPLKR
jgi:hypothetical protein